MVLKIAKRGRIPSFIVMDIMNKSNELQQLGQDILHLEVGQPGTGAPSKVVEAVVREMKRDKLGYTPAFGRQELREKIAHHYKSFYDYEVGPERIAITSGSSGAFILAFLSAFDTGDTVAMASPCYPAYRNILKSLGVKVVEVQTTLETNFQLTVEILEKVRRDNVSLDGLIIASPSNPTGTMLNQDELKSISRYCSKFGIRLISDEIYHGITYTLTEETAIKFNGDAIVINSFSKFFSMTGWRLGWMVMPQKLIRATECLAQNLFISPPAVSQVAGLAALDCKNEFKQNVAIYKMNRDILLSELPKMGFSKNTRSDGAFYVYTNVEDFTHDSSDFCNKILKETGIALTPGIDFDPIRGHSYIRLSFSGPTSEINEAVKRLKNWL